MLDRYLILLLTLKMMITGADTKLIIRFNRLSIVIACIFLIPYAILQSVQHMTTSLLTGSDGIFKQFDV